MNRLLLIVIPALLLIPQRLPGQQYSQVKAVASPLKMNVLYVGVDNPVNVAVPGADCDQLHVEISQGEIWGSGCSYTIGIPKPGGAYLYIGIIDSGIVRFVDTLAFRVKRIPDPVPMFGSRKWYVDSIPIQEVKAVPGILVRAEGFDFDVRFQVINFTLTISRRDSIIFNGTSSTALFTAEMRKAFMTELRPNDTLRIEDIIIRSPDDTQRKLVSLKYLVYDPTKK